MSMVIQFPGLGQTQINKHDLDHIHYL